MKAELRKEIKAKRIALTEFELSLKSKALAKNLFELPEFQEVLNVCFFVGVKNEVRTREMIEQAIMQGKRISVPLTDFENGHLHLSRLYSVDDLEENHFYLLEPREDAVEIIEPTEVDLFVIPGIAFDKKGNRLGQGKGFYDRLLPQAKPEAKKIALTFELQLVEKVPTEEHDVKMDKIVTEKRTIECK